MSVMATATYNEVYNAITQADGTIVPETSKRDPMFHWDTHYPDMHLSRLTISPDFCAPAAPSTGGGGGGSAARRAAMRNRRNRTAARFKTQPITFDEIKEVDEETTSPVKPPTPACGPQDGGEPACKDDLKAQFTVFSRSMDGLVAGTRAGAGRKASAGDGGAAPGGAGTTVRSRPLSEYGLTGLSGSSECCAGGADSSEGDDSASKASKAQAAAIQRQQFRQRRKKRHTKSIEEAPELDRIEVLDT